MHFARFFAVSALVAAAAASPIASSSSSSSSSHAVHEKRAATPKGWTKRAAVDRRAILPMRVGLAQNNLDKGGEWLNEVSHPHSAKYGQHWSAKDVAEAFAPGAETVDAVKAWLADAGIGADRVRQSQSLTWLEFDASVAEAEDLLHTKYHVYEHGTSGQRHVACDQYSVPAHLTPHVDLIAPTVHFDAKVVGPGADRRVKKRDSEPGVSKGLGQPGSGSLPKGGWSLPKLLFNLTAELDSCDEYITPNCLRALYEFPVNLLANSKNSYGIVEYTPQAYVPSDLDLFFQNYSILQKGDRPILDSIDGGTPQQEYKGFSYNGESNLDLEYAMSLVYPQKVTLYQTGDEVEGASFNNFLDAIDGSYCTYKGGDDPTQDAVYPDPYGGYQGPQNCGGFAATNVISTSYGYNEHDLTPFYEKRQCHEYMKLGLMGVTVLYSSGDYGVAGNGGECLSGPGENASYTDGEYGYFNPAFPSSCPYITSVGATEVKPNTSIVQSLATGVQPEKACETVIYSGGGFSNVFDLPDYQADAVQGWFDKYPPPYGSDRFNNSGKTRGFPDISANGANYVVSVVGEWELVYGTSASAPVLGSILTLINEARLDVGKNPIGFINPVAYENPWAFNDITTGDNPGCGTDGFSASPGWDPVTGLGTPNYPKLLALFLALP